MSTSVSIKGKTAGGDGVTTTINYVNPTATDEQLQSLATAFNNLTTNITSDITKITKESLTNSGKLDRNMTLTPSTISFTAVPTITGGAGTSVTIAGSGFSTSDIRVSRNLTLTTAYLYADWYAEEDHCVIEFVRSESDEKITGEIVIEVPATGNYKSGSVTLTVGE